MALLNPQKQVPKKHHFIPQFYLERWTINGRLAVYRRANPRSNVVSVHLKPPKTTGWHDGLYDFHLGIGPNKHALEVGVFRPVDGFAAQALALLEKGAEVRDARLREAWVLFLISLIIRHPTDIRTLRRTLLPTSKR